MSARRPWCLCLVLCDRRLLAIAYCEIGERDKAIEIFEKWIAEDPESPVARHMLAAVSGRDIPARASDDYVALSFDSFAESFERKLEQLSYRAPSLVACCLLMRCRSTRS